MIADLPYKNHGNFIREEWPWHGGGAWLSPQLPFTQAMLALHLLPQEKSSGRTAHYKLTSTVMLWLQTNKSGSGTMNLGGSLTRQVDLVFPPLASALWY